MLRKDYTIPQLQDLFAGPKIVKERYLRDTSVPNPARLELIDILNATVDLLKQHDTTTSNIPEMELREIGVGAYIFCFESIAARYRLLNPEFSGGYFFNSGSKLYQLLLQQLKMSEDNKIDDRSKLILLSKFYNFMFKKNKKATSACLLENKMTFNTVELYVRQTLKSAFNHVDVEANKLIKAIPTESAIDSKMVNMQDDYLAKADSDNPDRKLLVKLVVAVSTLIPANKDNDLDLQKHFLKRTQRIKMGLLLYIMQSILDTYSLRSPAGRSALYNLCRETLNIDKLTDIDSYTKLACLSAFETFITDGKNIEKLESEVKQYVDPKIHQIRKQVDKMIETLANTHPQRKLSPVTLGLAKIGALIAAAPGYGSGYAIGYTLSQTNEVVGPKLAVSKVTSFAMALILHDAGNYLGYFASNMIVDAALERAFAKVFESLAMLVGTAAGGMLGLIIYDLTFETLRDLCVLVVHLHSKIDPNLAKDFDPKFVECLLELPAEVFSADLKIKVQSITQGCFFSSVGTKSAGAGVDLLMHEDVLDEKQVDVLRTSLGN